MVMERLGLRKIKISDKGYFAKWWRDTELLACTSGVLEPISDTEVEKYFSAILKNTGDFHFMITLSEKTLGHISLVKRKNGWYETQIIIGEKEYWGKGYGTEAIRMLLQKARRAHISKIFLEVRPTNTRAIATYRKSGFVEAGLKTYPNNKCLPEVVRMKLREDLPDEK